MSAPRVGATIFIILSMFHGQWSYASENEVRYAKCTLASLEHTRELGKDLRQFVRTIQLLPEVSFNEKPEELYCKILFSKKLIDYASAYPTHYKNKAQPFDGDACLKEDDGSAAYRKAKESIADANQEIISYVDVAETARMEPLGPEYLNYLDTKMREYRANNQEPPTLQEGCRKYIFRDK